MSKKSSRNQGPYIYRNWQAALSGQEWYKVFEYPLYTDAYIVGEVGLGPYQILNPVRVDPVFPSLVLRASQHYIYELPSLDGTQDHDYHGGFEQDEIAALISLCLGIRLKAGDANRAFSRNEDPRGRPIGGWFSKRDTVNGPPRRLSQSNLIMPSATESHNVEDATILSLLPILGAVNAIELVRAARMYQEAVWIVETAPELSWLMLVSAVEVVANAWRSDSISSVEKLRLWANGEIEKVLKKHHAGDDLIQDLADAVAKKIGVSRTFRDFLMHFLPPPPEKRPHEFAQLAWDRRHLKKSLTKSMGIALVHCTEDNPFPPQCANILGLLDHKTNQPRFRSHWLLA